MVRREMEQNYHAPSNQVIQYKFLEKIQNEQGATLDKYRVAAVDREIIEGYYQLLSALKLKPVAYGYQHQCHWKAIGRRHHH